MGQAAERVPNVYEAPCPGGAPSWIVAVVPARSGERQVKHRVVGHRGR
jgi:hypothetical protein